MWGRSNDHRIADLLARAPAVHFSKAFLLWPLRDEGKGFGGARA
jgi:hypothetical protein